MIGAAATAAASATPAFAQSDRSSGIAICRNTRAVVAQHGNVDAVRPIMSVTKLPGIHLYLTAVKQGRIDPDEPVSFSQSALNVGGGHLVGLRWGDSFPSIDLAAFSVRNSCNICAEMIGERLYGSRHAAVEAYTDFIRGIGLTRTHLASPSGMNVGDNYGGTTVREMVMMGMAIDSQWEHHPLYQRLIDPSGYQITNGRTIEVMSHVRRPRASRLDESGFLVLGKTGDNDVPRDAVSLKTGSYRGGENNVFKFDGCVAGVLDAPHQSMLRHTSAIMTEGQQTLAMQGQAAPLPVPGFALF